MKTATQITEGPFDFATADNAETPHIAIYSEMTGERIADVYTSEADAQLFVASLGLLDACRRMLASLENVDFSPLPGVYDTIPFAVVESAIANAVERQWKETRK